MSEPIKKGRVFAEVKVKVQCPNCGRIHSLDEAVWGNYPHGYDDLREHCYKCSEEFIVSIQEIRDMIQSVTS